jgi:hypothetical protein
VLQSLASTIRYRTCIRYDNSPAGLGFGVRGQGL